MPDLLADRRGALYSLMVMAEVIDQSTGVQLSARMTNVSRAGCYVDTLNPMKAGTDVRLVLKHKGLSFETIARVVYVSPGLGMGMRFEEPLPSAQIAALETWLKPAKVEA